MEYAKTSSAFGSYTLLSSHFTHIPTPTVNHIPHDIPDDHPQVAASLEAAPRRLAHLIKHNQYMLTGRNLQS